MWKRALIPSLLGFGLLWNFFANIDWVIIHTFHPQMTPSIGQVMEKYKKKTGQRGIGAASYFIRIQGIKSPYCGGEADVDVRFFEKVKIKDQIPISVRGLPDFFSSDTACGKQRPTKTRPDTYVRVVILENREISSQRS
jgi:hypothetical protein